MAKIEEQINARLTDEQKQALLAVYRSYAADQDDGNRKAKLTDFTSGTVALNETTRCAPNKANVARYRVTLPSKQEASLTVTERHAGETTYRLVDFDDRAIADAQRSITQGSRTVVDADGETVGRIAVLLELAQAKPE